MNEKRIPIIIFVFIGLIAIGISTLFSSLSSLSKEENIFGLSTIESQTELDLLLSFKVFTQDLISQDDEVDLKYIEIYKNSLFSIFEGLEETQRAKRSGQVNIIEYDQISSLSDQINQEGQVCTNCELNNTRYFLAIYEKTEITFEIELNPEIPSHNLLIQKLLIYFN